MSNQHISHRSDIYCINCIDCIRVINMFVWSRKELFYVGQRRTNLRLKNQIRHDVYSTAYRSMYRLYNECLCDKGKGGAGILQ